MTNLAKGIPPAARPKALSLADLVQAAVFAALIAVLGLTPAINLSAGVPITLQSLGIMLAGAILGPKKGTLAVVIFMVLAIAGLPILSGGRTGLVSLTAPTAGFFVGFLPAVIVIGVLTAMMMPKYNIAAGIVINLIGGMAVLYACGTVGLMIKADMGLGTALATNGPFVVGDLIKAVVAALIAAPVHRGRPGLITHLGRRRHA